MNAVFPRINVDEGTVEFTWMYNDSVNDVPTSNFSLTIRLGGQNVFTDTLLASRRSFSVPLSMLMDGQTYTVDVVVWNLQGNSLAISQIFNVPRSSSIGKNLMSHACSVPCQLVILSFITSNQDPVNTFLISQPDALLLYA